MKDQYGNEVLARDLVYMPDMLDKSEAELEASDYLNWYEAQEPAATMRDVLLVSGAELEKLIGDELETPDDEPTSVMLIDRPLHRYSQEDGWYHA